MAKRSELFEEYFEDDGGSKMHCWLYEGLTKLSIESGDGSELPSSLDLNTENAKRLMEILTKFIDQQEG